MPTWTISAKVVVEANTEAEANDRIGEFAHFANTGHEDTPGHAQLEFHDFEEVEEVEEYDEE